MKLLKYIIFMAIILFPITVSAKGYEIVSGDLNTVGSIVKIDDEEFYVIGKEDDSHIKLFSKYNLNIENSKQSLQAGNVPFATTQYWWDQENKTVLDEYDSVESVVPEHNESSIYVYDNSASISNYVDDYVDYLKTLDVCSTGRLINRDELHNLGCEDNCLFCSNHSYYCDNSKEWFQNSNFWTGEASVFKNQISEITTGVNRIFSDAYGTDNVVGQTSYVANADSGVRPVIILDINNSCLPENKQEVIVNDVEEEKFENPQTGAFLSISLVVILIISSILLYIYAKKKNRFSKL